MSNIIQSLLFFILIINIVSSSTLSFRNKKKLSKSRLLLQKQKPDCQPENITSEVFEYIYDEDTYGNIFATTEYFIDQIFNEGVYENLFEREVNKNFYSKVEVNDHHTYHDHIQKCKNKNLICIWGYEWEGNFVPYSEANSFECINVTKIVYRDTSCVNQVNTFCTYEDASEIADALTEMKQNHCAE